MVFQLLDIATFLSVADAFRAVVIDQPDLLRTLDHPVEIIGPDGILVLIGGQAEAPSEFRRDEGGAHAPTREHALVGAQDNQVPEIQGTGFQRPHHLQTLQRFPAERHGNALEQALQQADMRGRKDLQVHFLQDIQLFVAARHKVQFQIILPSRQGRPEMRQQLGKIRLHRMVLRHVHLGGRIHHRLEKEGHQRPRLKILEGDVVLGIGLYLGDGSLLLFREKGLQKAGGEDFAHLAVVEEPSGGGMAEAQLHLAQVGKKGKDGAACHGITHGHVHIVVALRDGVQQR